MMIGLGLLGLTGSAAQSAMFALGAHAFPAAARAGHGADGGGGADRCPGQRSGRVVAGGGTRGIFAVLGGLMIVNMLSFLTVRGHIPRLTRGRAEDLR
jgi:AAHS family 4-hydroxybenzoate transporter-like MFS transporter